MVTGTWTCPWGTSRTGPSLPQGPVRRGGLHGRDQAAGRCPRRRGQGVRRSPGRFVPRSGRRDEDQIPGRQPACDGGGGRHDREPPHVEVERPRSSGRLQRPEEREPDEPLRRFLRHGRRQSQPQLREHSECETPGVPLHDLRHHFLRYLHSAQSVHGVRQFRVDIGGPPGRQRFHRDAGYLESLDPRRYRPSQEFRSRHLHARARTHTEPGTRWQRCCQLQTELPQRDELHAAVRGQRPR